MASGDGTEKKLFQNRGLFFSTLRDPPPGLAKDQAPFPNFVLQSASTGSHCAVQMNHLFQILVLLQSKEQHAKQGNET